MDIQDSKGKENDQLQRFEFEGRQFGSYQEMVAAKRQRNHDWLEQNGLLKASTEISKRSPVVQRGLVGNHKKTQEPATKRRKSNRLAGVAADGQYIEDERRGTFQLAGDIITNVAVTSNVVLPNKKTGLYCDRINNGEDLSVKDAVELSETKSIDEHTVSAAKNFMNESLALLIKSDSPRRMSSASETIGPLNDIPTAVSYLNHVIADKYVAKVTPDRIYSVACHPSPNSLIVGAGDKLGHVGLWSIDESKVTAKDGAFLFRVHGRPVTCLEWIVSGKGLLSASYDGSVRWLDVEAQKFSQIFATYDASGGFERELGYGLDTESKSWVQFCLPDSRYCVDKCFFLSTSNGRAFHVDLRMKGSVSFNEKLSEKKVNTLSLHPDGNLLASAGLDCTLKIWDVRKFGSSRQPRTGRNNKFPALVSEYNAGKSINSAFFSPSGKALVSTAMTNKLEIFADPHLAKGNLEPVKRVPHDNRTGRWLSTFMACWHPSLDIFVVGSMQQPRAIEVFDRDGHLLRRVQGNALTAVASRCCFHPSPEKLVIVGGNSSGRIVVAGAF